MSDAAAGWDSILEAGETLLWQGRPAGRVSMRGLDPRRLLFGFVFLGFALFWTIGAARAGAPGPMGLLFPLFGLPFIAIGARLVGGGRLWSAFLQRHSWYSLTSRRAIIATDFFGRRALHSWPITAQTVLDLVEGPPDSVHFADRKRRSGSERFGFEQISEGREVLNLMRRVQRGAA